MARKAKSKRYFTQITEMAINAYNRCDDQRLKNKKPNIFQTFKPQTFKPSYPHIRHMPGIRFVILPGIVGIFSYSLGFCGLLTNLQTYCMPVVKTNDPQAMGSAITYARRYALGSILGLNIDEDDDGEKAMQRNKVEAKPQEKPFINPAMVQWEKAVEHIKGGGAIDDILKKYQLKPEHLTILKAVK